MTDLVPLSVGAATYTARITPLRTGGRRDVELSAAGDSVAFRQNDIIARLRQFFADLDDEARSHRGDPVALSQALARMDALLADVRSVRDTLRSLAAHALADEKVRRLTIEQVCTVEASTEVRRTDWQHERLLGDMLNKAEMRGLTSDGEVIAPEQLAALVLSWLRPEWRMTPIRDAGLDPDNYCTMMADDDGKPVREPTVRIVTNDVRKITTP